VHRCYDRRARPHTDKPSHRFPARGNTAVRHLPQPRDWWGHGKKKRSFRQSPSKYNNGLGLPLLKNMAGDQKAIWSSPFHLRLRDANWLVPLGGLVAALFATDTEVSRHLSTSPSRINESRTFSNMGAASLIGAAGGLYLLARCAITNTCARRAC